MKEGAVYLRDLVSDVPDSVPPTAPAARVTSKTLPPPPLNPQEIYRAPRGRPPTGTLVRKAGGWYGRFLRRQDNGARRREWVFLHATSRARAAEELARLTGYEDREPELGLRYEQVVSAGAVRRGTGTLELRSNGWAARFVFHLGTRVLRPRWPLNTSDREVAARRLERLDFLMEQAERLRGQEPPAPRAVEAPLHPPQDPEGPCKRTNPNEFISWKLALRRCTCESDPNWKYYGGRGIRMHAEWMNERGFANFLKDMGPRPPDHVLGRKDKNGHIVPGNVFWMPRSDVRVGVRKNYDTAVTTTRFVQLVTWPNRLISQVRISEHNNLIRLQGVEGGLTPQEADELARMLICVADAMRRRRSVNDAAR